MNTLNSQKKGTLSAKAQARAAKYESNGWKVSQHKCGFSFEMDALEVRKVEKSTQKNSHKKSK